MAVVSLPPGMPLVSGRDRRAALGAAILTGAEVVPAFLAVTWRDSVSPAFDEPDSGQEGEQEGEEPVGNNESVEAAPKRLRQRNWPCPGIPEAPEIPIKKPAL